MDSWITIAESDVLASINNSELTAALSTAIGGDQSADDIIASLIADVTMEVRGYIRSRNTLGPDGTVPQELKNAAIDIIIYRAACRVNKAADAKKPMHEIALKKLRDVADGLMKVSAPDNPTAQVTSAPSPAMHQPHRRFGSDEERGI